jgi:hypothetical protein
LHFSANKFTQTKTFLRTQVDPNAHRLSDNGRWIDHILTGGDITHTRHYADREHVINQTLDHIPFISKMTLPNAFRRHKGNGKEYSKAQQLNNYIDIDIQNTQILEKYQEHLLPLVNYISDNFIIESIASMPVDEVTTLLTKIHKDLIAAAQKINPTNSKHRTTKRTLCELISRTSRALHQSALILRSITPTNTSEKSIVQATQKIRKKFKLLLKKLWDQQSPKTGQYLFRTLLTSNTAITDIKDLIAAPLMSTPLKEMIFF